MTDAASRTLRRYLALWFPFLPADRLLRREPRQGSAKPGEPLVFIEKVKGALQLAAVDARALALGLTPGLTLADARARVPNLAVTDLDPAADAALLERLADGCDRWTPFVALSPRDGLILDITGCAHLLGGEAGLRADLLRRLEKGGFSVRASIADTPDAAFALARFGQAAIVPPGEGEAAVKSLPVAALGIEPATAVALARAGLKSIGDLADRPSAPLAARFGEDLLARLRRVLGQENVRITPRRPLPACRVERAFPEPIARAEDIEATLANLAAQAAVLLERRGEGGRAFEASFFRADGMVRRITVETGRPSRDSKAILRLYRERLDVLRDPIDPGFGFDLVRLAVPVTEILDTAQTSLDGHVLEGEEVAGLVDRLVARFGRNRVLRFVAQDTHDPLRAARFVPAVEHAEEVAPWSRPEPGEPPVRPLHVFDPPQPIETIAEVPDGPPAQFRWRRVLHVVARAEGPERIAPEWWRQQETKPTRDYFRVEDAEGRRFWVFREGLYERETKSPRWFLHGLFA